MLEVKILDSQKRLWSPGPALGDAGPIEIIIIAVLCKTTVCCVLLCVLEQPRVDNFRAGPNWEQLVQLL